MAAMSAYSARSTRVLQLTAALLAITAPALGQSRGGAVGSFHGVGTPPGIRPFAPIYVPGNRFNSLPVNAYRPNSGYIPYVGYYLPKAPAARASFCFPPSVDMPIETTPAENL